MSTVAKSRIIEFPKIAKEEGNITPVESPGEIPFEIKRVYYLYDVPGGEVRGGHAHLKLEQVIVSLMGSFDVVLKDGEMTETVTLNRAYFGLYVPKMTWREIVNISSGAICVVMASEVYERSDYIYDFAEFVKKKRNHTTQMRDIDGSKKKD